MLDPDFETNLIKRHEAEIDGLKAMGRAKRDGDEAAYHKAGLRLVATERAARSELKAEALRYAKELKINPMAEDDAKVVQLLQAFARGCRLGRLWSDLMNEISVGTRHVKKIYRIVLPALDAIGRRGDLAKLIDDPDFVGTRPGSVLAEGDDAGSVYRHP